MEYTYETGKYGVDHLSAPYALLLEAFGNDGTVDPRDDYKSMCRWTNRAVGWEVYDYKVGTCYAKGDGLAREDITVWSVQATETGAAALRAQLDSAARRLSAEAFEDSCREANGRGVEQDEFGDLVNELGDGGTVVIGEIDEDGFFVVGGIEINLDKVMVGVGTGEGEDFSAPLSLADVRKAHALLGAYLAIVDAKQD